ncbi:endocuticle structural glycoprotein SgAbd-8 [Copidosoma floridanum]|uniref:endocuticle structural glycoprotein SgAbd-8 n=1 Tax=Copidosoma floridanum TaxID=29053 RepID=UPI0006C99425|nr:endocuticle structural glycoprotein SgAbd-8 [Copidosoma floridanum]
MKFFIAVVALAAVATAAPQSHHEPIAILKQTNDVSPDGSYSWSFETENGIAAGESGVPQVVGDETPVVAQGSYAYTAPDGTPIGLSYVANENGFQPQGSHLPTPPTIPEPIMRALEYIRTHPQPAENSRF